MQRVEKVFERVTELPFSPMAAKILALSQDDRVGARETSSRMPSLLGAKPVTFETDYDLNSDTVVTDRIRLRGIFDHLLDNAAKFTREGKIVLRARMTESGCEIVVEDTGIDAGQ